MLVMGVGMAAIWTMDIARSPEVDRSRGLLRARDRSTGSLLVPHWLAEYGTAALLLVGGAGLLLGWEVGAWAWLVAVGLGALAYTSLNSLGWVLADRARLAYAVPMAVGLVGALMSLALLVAGAACSRHRGRRVCSQAPRAAWGGAVPRAQPAITGSIGYGWRISPPDGATR